MDRREEEIVELKQESAKPDFWQDQARAVATGKKIEELEREVGRFRDLKKEVADLEQLVAVAAKENDLSFADEANEQYDRLVKAFNELEFLVLFSGKHDASSAIISIHAGTGGVDAQDWAEMLERMFLRFAERQGWRSEIVDRTVGNEAGIKSATYRISGRWAYGYLKSENGVHRLVRISPFDSEAMRHTSFALIEVIPELPENKDIEIRNEDLRIDVFRSSGPGGQGVNTTDSAVRLVHAPTGIVVTCQTERSQHQNKETALKILKAKLLQLQEEEKERKELSMRGQAQKAEWGKQIRSYVLQPYQMAKDHRTNHETGDVQAVLNGKLEEFMEAYLRKQKNRHAK